MRDLKVTTPAPFHPLVWWLPVAVAGAGMIAIGTPIEAALAGVPVVLALAAAVLQAGGIALAAITPRTAIAFHLLGMAINAYSAGGTGVPWPLSVTALIGFAVFLTALTLSQPAFYGFIALVAGSALLMVVVAVSPERWGALPDAITNLIVSAAISALVLVAALAAAERIRAGEELASVRRDVAVEQERRRHGEERARIAREMHDVVAHSMSAVSMRATSAPYRLPGLDPVVRDEFAAIADSARTALAELRQLLAVLRSADEVPSFAPQPDLGALDELVSSARGSGLEVEYHREGAAGAIPAVVQLAGYRIVQEALSNAIRHAPKSKVAVEVRIAPGELAIDVVDDGPGARDELDGPGTRGHGIIGMTERVDALGGRIRTGTRPEGGFAVIARLPFEPNIHEEEPTG